MVNISTAHTHIAVQMLHGAHTVSLRALIVDHNDTLNRLDHRTHFHMKRLWIQYFVEAEFQAEKFSFNVFYL